MQILEKLKTRWDIEKNWQLLFPFLGFVALAYSSFKLSNLFLEDSSTIFIFLLSIAIFFALMKLILIIFNKLETKWKINHKWEMINIFLVFAVTGSSSVFVSRPIIKFMGINKENLPDLGYWILYILIGFIFYQILLVSIGWLFGQYQFFWNFEKKMLRRIGLKRFVD